jgi:hypothetical protein
MEAMPNLQQDALRIFPPMMIPKTQLFDALPHQPLPTLAVMQILFRQAVLKAIRFNREVCQRAVKVQKKFPALC